MLILTGVLSMPVRFLSFDQIDGVAKVVTGSRTDARLS